jgi:hypothetical protein
MAKAKTASNAFIDFFTPKGKSKLPAATIKQIEEIDSQGVLPVEPKVTAAERAAAGRAAAELIKSQPQGKMSEALGALNVEGFGKLSTTQADRTRVGGGNIGGAAFPAISEVDPNYAGKSWGVMDYGQASRLTNLTTPDTIWTTMLGAADQLKSNPIVFAKLEKQFKEAMKQGKLSPELEQKINHNLRLIMGEDANIRDPETWKEINTFQKRAAVADLMMGQGIPPSKGGVSLGGEKSGKGVIFKPTETLIRETEPSLMHPEYGGDAPTFAVGPRLFTMEKDVSYRPDLHPGFPTLIHGRDLGQNVKPVPTEIALPDWHKRFQEVTGGVRKPGYYDLALGLKDEGLPKQVIDHDYLMRLSREGYADGGMVESPPQQAIADTVRNPNAARMLEMDLANLAVMNQQPPQRMKDGGKPEGGFMSDVYKWAVPAHARTFVETLAGDQSPITEKNFSSSELEMMRDAIMRSRRDRQAGNQMAFHEQMGKATSDKELAEIMRRGAPTTIDQTVGYQHYPGSPTSLASDFDITSDAAIRNTLGRFAYEKDADGNLIATDMYKFRDDLSGKTRPSSDYAGMSTGEKLWTLLKDSGGKELTTLPSRIGSAFLGNKPGRPVTVNLGKAKFADGGLAKFPTPEEMLIEMMERGYGKR